MSTPAHKGNTETAAQLTATGRARSISAQINNLSNLIELDIRKSPDPDETRKKRVQQVYRLLGRLMS